MPTARVVTVRPRPGSEGEVGRIMGDIGDWLRTQKGFIANLGFVSEEERVEIVGIIFWDTREDGDRAATTGRTLALMSELGRVAGEEGVSGGQYMVTEESAGTLKRLKQ